MKTKLLYLLIIIFSSQNIGLAQTKFSRFFWQTLGERIFSTAVTELSGGGYVMAGTVRDSAAGSLTDIFLAKFSATGDTIWTKRIGGSGSEEINDIQQTNDGGLILTGWSNSYGSIYGNVLLLKTDSSGNAVWVKVFGNNTTSGSEGYSVRQNADSGFVIAGEIMAPIYKSLIIRTNSIGDTLWTKTYGLGTYSKATYAEENPAGEFIISLEADTLLSGSYLEILKITSSGVRIWAKKVVSPASLRFSNGIIQTLDGGYLLTGVDYLSGADLVVLKFDNSGNYIFGKNFHPTFNGNLRNLQATQLADSTYNIVASFSSVILQSSMALMLKLNTAGDTIFTRSLPNTYFNYGGAFTSDGGFVSVDLSGSIYKLDSSFNMECIPSVQGSCTSYDYICSNSFPYDSVAALVVSSGNFTNIGNAIRKLYTPCTPNIPTCVVTVDSATQKNLVVWEENFDTTFIDSYQVYKESAAAGIYNLIGSVPHNQFSTFLDTSSNPAAQSNRYRVSALWHTYYEPPNSIPGHKTIHLMVSPGLPPTMNLSWSTYEGFTYSTYNIWRGNSITSSIIVSLPFGTNNYTDLNPPAGDSLYYVEVVHAPCNPSFRFGNGGGGDFAFSSYNGAISNRFNTSMYFVGRNDIELSSGISLSPVPAANDLFIVSENFPVQSAIITNTMGQQLAEYNFDKPARDQIQLDIADLSPGVYSLQLFGIDHNKISKLFIKR